MIICVSSYDGYNLLSEYKIIDYTILIEASILAMTYSIILVIKYHIRLNGLYIDQHVVVIDIDALLHKLIKWLECIYTGMYGFCAFVWFLDEDQTKG